MDVENKLTVTSGESWWEEVNWEFEVNGYMLVYMK